MLPIDNRNQPSTAISWTEEDLNRLVGIGSDGLPSGIVIAAVLADASRYPQLFTLINAPIGTN